MGKMLAITDKQPCSPACSDSHHYPGKSIMRHGLGGEMDPFGSHIQSMAASSPAAECTAHVSPRPVFKPALTGGGKASGGWGGTVLSHFGTMLL